MPDNRANAAITPPGVLLLVSLLLLVVRLFTLDALPWLVALTPLAFWAAWVLIRAIRHGKQ